MHELLISAALGTRFLIIRTHVRREAALFEHIFFKNCTTIPLAVSYENL